MPFSTETWLTGLKNSFNNVGLYTKITGNIRTTYKTPFEASVNTCVQNNNTVNKKKPCTADDFVDTID